MLKLSENHYNTFIVFSSKKRAKVSYRSLHYVFSLSSKWHDIWSDFSSLDQVFVMFLDQINGMVIVSASFAYGKPYFNVLIFFRIELAL